jgi:phosphoribosylamine--glycine ligase
MKVAMTSYSGYGSWFMRRLVKERHDVTYFLTNPDVADVNLGLVPKPRLKARPDYSNFDLSIFDLTGRSRTADASAEVCLTIGDGTVNCKLEDDRAFGIELMEAAGINVPPYEQFGSAKEAMAYVRKSGKRFVYKPNGGQDQDADTTYVAADAEDMLGYLGKMEAKLAGTPCILQEFVSGTEVSVEGWFDGSEFWLLNSTLEDKKFMNDNRGPNTGCSGNLVLLIGRDSKIYREGLEKAKDVFQSIGYKGMIDLNTIVTEEKAYGLEWTPRFGYDASATLCRMYAGDYGEMLATVASGNQPDHLFSGEYGVSIRLSIPPYPSEIKGKHKSGVVCKGIDPDRDFTYDFARVGANNSVDPDYITAGVSGFIGAPVIVGNDPVKAWAQIDHIVDGIKIPNMQYRTDCDKSSLKKLAKLKTQGWL